MPYINKKTKDRYDVLAIGLDCTNARADTKVVVYIRHCWWSRIIRALLFPRLVFVREFVEFKEKFEGE